MRQLAPVAPGAVATARRRKSWRGTADAERAGIENRVRTKAGGSGGREPKGASFAVAAILLVLGVMPVAWSQPAQKSSDSLVHGQQIFSQRCAECHGERGQGVSGVVSIAGPNLQAEHNLGQVLTAVEVGPSHMPSFARVLSVQDMRDVAEFVTQKIAVIPMQGGNLSEGSDLYAMYCSACHRTDVRGGALVFDGVNAPDLSRKSRALVAGAIRWGPGPMPNFPASVLNDQQVASIADYVKYTQHPPSPGGSPLRWYGPVAEGFVAWVIAFSTVVLAMWIERGGKG
jgi:ubiquinol-cytochrome c reductase cytochrome c subunit